MSGWRGLGRFHREWETYSPANAGDSGGVGSIPRLGRSPRGDHSSSLAGKIPWTEETGRLQSLGLQSVRHYQATEHKYIGNLNWDCQESSLCRGNQGREMP